MALSIYLNFNGNCREAVAFYADVFKTEKNQIMTYGEAHQEPGFPMDEKTKNLIMHTFLMISGTMVMFSDTPPGMPFVEGNNVTLVITSKDLDEISSLYSNLKEGGSVIMELQETFWSKSYAYITDKFGIGWQLSHGE